MVGKAEVYYIMGYGTSSPDPQTDAVLEELLPQAVAAANPSYVYRIVPARVVDKTTILLDGVEFKVGGIISSYLAGMTHACVFIGTAGVEYDCWLQSIKSQDDILYEYVADAIGSVIAEDNVDRLASELDGFITMRRSFPYSPGYCGWDVADQKKLFSLIPGDHCGVTLTESCLMHPVKSVSGFFAMGDELVPQPYRCGLCTNRKCFKNKNK